MRDISARELKGHNILAVERFRDETRWMIEFSVRSPRAAYGSPGDEMRLFLTEDGYQAALLSQRRREIKIKRYARIIEGHILDFKPKNTTVTRKQTPRKERNEYVYSKKHPDAIRECCQSQHDMEPIEIDQIVDNLPFFKEKSLFDTPPLPKPPYGRRKRPHSS